MALESIHWTVNWNWTKSGLRLRRDKTRVELIDKKTQALNIIKSLNFVNCIELVKETSKRLKYSYYVRFNSWYLCYC